jgi:nitrate/TMAO reductase-like tetraheme cytochrome c subunit
MNLTPQRPAWFLLTRHWLSLLGAALVTTAVISWLFVLPLHVRGHVDNPYIGIVIFLILPIVFFIGLALIPIGVYMSKRRVADWLEEPVVDRRTALRRLAWFLGITTLLNILVGTQITYRAVHYMETPDFCGATCHTMAPEFAAYRNSPHARVECVECHVAPGARGWIESKMNGTRQAVETVLNTVPKPIPSALASNRLVPARETCENCHWPQKFVGVRLRVFSRFAEDEANVRTETVLLMMIGGDQFSGIHGAHFGPGIHIRFASASPDRQSIPRVEYRNTNTGDVETFTNGDPPDASKPMAEYEMQCVDCHNRPTHTFDLPERAMDKAMAFGEIPTTLPFIKKEGVEVLKASYPSSKDATDMLPQNLAHSYQINHPQVFAQRAQDIDRAAKVILGIYSRNVFPDLQVTWGTYPNNLGHTDFPGCFRCHDGSHTAKSGKTITQDCNACHQPLAMDEASPQILTTLGIQEQILQSRKF